MEVLCKFLVWLEGQKCFSLQKLGWLVGWLATLFSGNFLIEFYLQPVAFGASAVQMFI